MSSFTEHKIKHHLSFLTAIPLDAGGWLELYTCTIATDRYKLAQIVRFHFWWADGLKYEELKV